MERAIARLPGAPGSQAYAAAALAAIGESYVDFAVRHPSHFRVMFGPCTQVEGFEPGRAPSGRGAFETASRPGAGHRLRRLNLPAH